MTVERKSRSKDRDHGVILTDEARPLSEVPCWTKKRDAATWR